MSEELLFEDHVSEIKKILAGPKAECETLLRKYIYNSRKLNNRHFQKSLTVDETVAKLIEPGWRRKVRDFDAFEWRRTMKTIWRRTEKIVKSPPIPKLVLYPSFGRFNGRVYRLDKEPVIGCSPDFPRCSKDNLRVLLAHEYAHYVRWINTGIPSDNIPIYAMIFEEGWAVWLSSKILPRLDTYVVFMSNLHGLIGMPNPRGGYLSWCRKHLKEIIDKARKILKSKRDKDLGCLFQCRRFVDDRTPIRVGYYLGYKLIESLLKKGDPGELLMEKPTYRKVSHWLDELEDSIYR